MHLLYHMHHLIIKALKRINTDSDVSIHSNVRKPIGVEGSNESSKSVFFILNVIHRIYYDIIMYEFI
jgi:hypothetical protein